MIEALSVKNDAHFIREKDLPKKKDRIWIISKGEMNLDFPIGLDHFKTSRLFMMPLDEL